MVGASCRAMAASLIRADYQVTAGDLFADYDTQQLAAATTLSKYPWSAPDWLSKTTVDAWCFTGGIENYPRLVQRMSRHAPLLGATPDALRKVRDPFWLADVAKRYGFHFPESKRLDEASSSTVFNEPWLKKPYRSAGGLRIETVQEPPGCSSQFFLQRQLSGTPMSMALLSTKKKVHVVGLCRLQIGFNFGAPGMFLFAGGVTSLQPVSQELRAIAEAIHAEAKMLGLWGIDFLQTDKPTVLEVNPRWTASMALHDRRSAIALMGMHVAACEGREVDALSLSDDSAAAFRILYARQPIDFRQEVFEQIAAAFDLSREATIAGPEFADVPFPGSRIETGFPVCTLYADGATEEEAEASLAAKIERVESLLY
ncbi:ATP-grasp domain-containing protein [Bremerella cremea]|uniref:ATP-grasp domain-containing protein n=1 Tax=Bremerella cremea TaxID=1031537 RepID=UPI0031EA7076